MPLPSYIDMGNIDFSPYGNRNFTLPPLPGGTEWDPQWAYSAWTKPWRNTGMGNYLEKNYNKYQNRYLGELPFNPMLTWEDYLRQANPEHDFAYTDPFQRGEQTSSFAGRNRWIG